MKTAKFAMLSILLLAGIHHSVSRQTPNELVRKAKKLYEKAEALYNLIDPTEASDKEAFSLYLQSAQLLKEGGVKNSIVIDAYIKAGNIKQTYSLHPEARALYFKSISENSLPAKDSSLLYESFLYLGTSYYLNNIIDSAKYYFEQSSLLSGHLHNLSLPDMHRLYNSLGAIYYQSGNYIQAKNYFALALTYVTNDVYEYDYDYASIASNIATCEQEINNYDEAIRIYKELLKRNSREEVIKQSLAHTYFRKGEYDSAYNILIQLELEPSVHQIKALNDLGKIYEQREQWILAEKQYDSAIAINQTLFGKLKNRERGISYQNKAMLAQKRGLNNEGLFWCNRALEELHINFKAANLKDLPKPDQSSVSPIITFEVLKLKADLFLKKFQQDKRKVHLFDAVNTFQAAFAESNYIKRTFDNDDARVFFNTNYRELFNTAIAAAFEAASLDEHYADILVYLLENYKGTILAHNITLQQLKAKSNIPEADLAKEKNLKDLISIYANRINSAATAQDGDPLRKRYVELQVELSRLQKKFEDDISFNYYRYQSGSENLTLKAIQDKLDNNTAVINYFADSTSIYSITISSNQYKLHRIPYNSSLKKELQSLISSLRDQTEGKRYDGIASSHNLFRQLLYPVQPIWENRTKLVVLPDGPLNLIPFDALSLSPTTPHYMVNEKTISYHYSYTLLTNKQQDGTTGTLDKSLAFAPFFKNDSSIAATQLPILTNSAMELKPLRGEQELGATATKQDFINEVANHSSVHLATHAFMNDTLPNNGWIEFYPSRPWPDSNRLFLSEIYNLNLNKARLVVLSACETAAGLYEDGEGLLSLSRAFLYAGASSVVSTLWKTEDKASAFLMTRFYHHLKEGEPKETALRLAKCDLMASEDISPVYKSPNYWSNFIYVGEVDFGHQSAGEWVSYRWKWLLFVGLLLGGVITWSKWPKRLKTKDAAAEV